MKFVQWCEASYFKGVAGAKKVGVLHDHECADYFKQFSLAREAGGLPISHPLLDFLARKGALLEPTWARQCIALPRRQKNGIREFERAKDFTDGQTKLVLLSDDLKKTHEGSEHGIFRIDPGLNDICLYVTPAEFDKAQKGFRIIQPESIIVVYQFPKNRAFGQGAPDPETLLPTGKGISPKTPWDEWMKRPQLQRVAINAPNENDDGSLRPVYRVSSNGDILSDEDDSITVYTEKDPTASMKFLVEKD